MGVGGRLVGGYIFFYVPLCPYYVCCVFSLVSVSYVFSFFSFFFFIKNIVGVIGWLVFFAGCVCFWWC